MQITEHKEHLFDADPTNYLINCISSDFVMGSGISISFRVKGVEQYLKRTYPTTWNGSGYALFSPISGHAGVYNLIVKSRYYHKPTYETMKEALLDLKQHIPDDCRLAMSHIGSGKDKLEWDQMKNIITDIFSDTNVNISIMDS